MQDTIYMYDLKIWIDHSMWFMVKVVWVISVFFLVLSNMLIEDVVKDYTVLTAKSDFVR